MHNPAKQVYCIVRASEKSAKICRQLGNSAISRANTRSVFLSRNNGALWEYEWIVVASLATWIWTHFIKQLVRAAHCNQKSTKPKLERWECAGEIASIYMYKRIWVCGCHQAVIYFKLLGVEVEMPPLSHCPSALNQLFSTLSSLIIFCTLFYCTWPAENFGIERVVFSWGCMERWQ